MGFSVDPYEEIISRRKNRRRRLILSAIACIAILTITVSVAAGLHKTTKSDNASRSSSTNTVGKTLKAVCAVTVYPNRCLSTISNSTSDTGNLTLKETVILAVRVSINETARAIRTISDLAKKPAGIGALRDCEDFLLTSLDQLNLAIPSVREFNVTALADTAGDVQTWLSAALTNVDTCRDEIGDISEESLRSKVQDLTADVRELMSNLLAIVKNISALVKPLDGHFRRKLLR